MNNNLNHQMPFISLNFQSWTPDHIEDSFSKNLLEQFDRKINQNLHSNHVIDQTDINMSETTFEEEDEDDERNFSSVASSQHLNDINISSTSKSSISRSFKIREHENPSSPAAAVVAAAKAASKKSSLDNDSCYSSSSIILHQQPQSQQKKKNMLKKSSMYFTEKIMKKKSIMFSKPQPQPTTTTHLNNCDKLKHNLDQKRRSSPGITIKPQQPENVKSTTEGWWRRLNNYLTRDDGN